MRVHHVGYAVSSIDDSALAFELLGFRVVSEKINDTGRNINVLFMQSGETLTELIETADITKPSPIDSIMRSNAMGRIVPYHLCFETEDLDEVTGTLRDKRFVIAAQRSPAPALGGEVVFMFHKNVGMIELLERTNTKEKI
jgi:methylmalonyl-CoA/ethylmalonyl-CoA epimerase